MKQIFWLFGVWLLVNNALAQVADNFSDGDFTTNPIWTGEPSKFEVATQRLHLNDVAATGEAYLSTISEAIADAEWNFYIEITENPSGSNFTSVYLVSDQANLAGNLNGYFVKIGNTADEVSLYRQDGSTQTEIIDGLDDRVDTKPVQIEVKVTRNATGNWELSSRPLGDVDFSLEGSVQDDTYTVSNYFGVYCKYTSTRKDAFYFDDILVSGTPQPDTQQPVITSLSVLSDTQLQIQFSETVTAATAETVANYTLPGYSASAATLADDLVTLSVNEALVNATDYSLNVRNIQDEAGNAMADTTLNFFYFEPVPAQWNDVVISELMPDPNPVKVDLPDAEFIELYNRSEHPFDLQNWTLNDKPLSSYILRPAQHIILCAAADSAAFAPFGNVLTLDSWPTLSNSGTQLMLLDATSTTLDSLSYSEDDVTGGTSLERIREETPCDQRTNLALSLAERGATPGQANTVTQTTPDTTAPKLLEAKASGNMLIELIFDEQVADVALITNNIQFQPQRTIASVVRDTIDEKTIWVTLTDILQNGTTYSLTFLNAQDCYGNQAASQTQNFYFDNQPPLVTQLIVRDTSAVEVFFSEKVENSAATEKENYQLDSATNIPKSVTLSEDSSSAVLSFSLSLDDGLEHQLAVLNLTDLYGNTADAQSVIFQYQQAIDTVVVVSEYQVDLYLQPEISPDAVNTSNLSIDRGVGQPHSAFLDSDDASLVHLVLAQPLTSNKEHELWANQLYDTESNLLSTPIYRFYYDQRAPTLDSVVAVNDRTLIAYFNETLLAAEATNAFHYQLASGSPNITQADLLADQQSVQLVLDSALLSEVEYELEVLGIADVSGNTISSTRSRTFVYDQHPPRLLSWKIVNPYQLRLYFSEAVVSNSSTDYQIESFGSPDSLLVSQIQSSEVRLFFTNPFLFDEATLTINQIADERGNSLTEPLQVAVTNANISLGQITVLSETEVQLEFSQPIDESVMQESGRYRLDQTLVPTSLIPVPEKPYALQLSFDSPFQPDVTYQLAIDEIAGLRGASSTGVQDSFVYQTQVERIEVENQSLLVYFQVPVDSSRAVQNSHYQLEEEHPVAALLVDEQTVRLVFNQSLEPLTRYQLSLSGLQTIDGDVIPESTHSVGLERTPEFNELLIAEIMADPIPVVGLPEVEYLEIYNASDDLLSTEGLRLADATSSALFPTVLILPGEYLIVTATADQSKMSAKGKTIGVSNFPSLNSTGDILRITDAYGQEIFSVAYADDWYNDAEKKQGGWSLEMIDYTRPCGERDNWIASVDESGGTPGRENSVSQPNPDNQAPFLTEAFAVSDTLVQLRFSEKIDPTSLSRGKINLNQELVVDTLVWSEDRKSAQLVLLTPLQAQTTYLIWLENLSDCSGNPIRNAPESFVLSEEAEAGDVLLSEILFYPRSGGVRFVEIYNHSDKPINLSGWQLANQEGDSLTNLSPIIEDNYQFASGQYLVLTEDATVLVADYPAASEGNILAVKSLPSLPSDAGIVVLLSPDGEQMQLLEYDEKWHHPVLDDVRGVSLERIQWEAAVNDANNWQSAAQTAGFATPGYANSQASSEFTSQATISVEPKVFTPNQDSFQDYTQIHYRWEASGNVANVIIFNSQGRKVRHLAQNATLAEEGFLRWDGTNDSQQLVPMGYYIIYFEVFHTNGQVSVLKERVVVGHPF
ncbi:MAG: lamin tail domain-containing protein [Bacteroidota bacterium]